MQLHLLGRSGDAAAPVRQEWDCICTLFATLALQAGKR